MPVAEDPLKPAAARVFLAIPLQKIFHQEMASLLEPLCGKVPGVRWTQPQQAHLTLHFFGSVSIKEIEPIHASAKKIASLFSPLKLTLDRIGGFPSLEKPETVWLGVGEPTGRLLSLQKAIQGEIQILGFRPEARPFQPHVTIGRVKWRSRDLAPLLVKIPFELPTPEKTADHFALYQSYNLSEGVRYEILKTYPFSKKA